MVMMCYWDPVLACLERVCCVLSWRVGTESDERVFNFPLLNVVSPKGALVSPQLRTQSSAEDIFRVAVSY